MRDLEPDACPLGRADRLLDRLECLGVAVARVGRIEGTVAGDNAAERLDFLLRYAALGRVLEPGTVPPRTVLKRLLELTRHRGELLRRRRSLLQADSGEPQLA